MMGWESMTAQPNTTLAAMSRPAYEAAWSSTGPFASQRQSLLFTCIHMHVLKDFLNGREESKIAHDTTNGFNNGPQQ